MDVSIIIRTKNEAEFVGETLEKVMGQEFKGTCEVIIVDSGSTDSTLQIVRNHDVKLLQISQEEFTYGRSLNIGAINAKGKFVVNLSAHALPRNEKWLTNLISGFEDNSVAGVYGRQLSNGHINPFEAMQNELFFGGEERTFIMNKRRLVRIHFSNSNSAIRRDVWEKFRFNEEVGYAEDILWQTEVMDAGYSIVYAPDAAVHHTHRVSVYGAYRNSRECAYALASMKKKRRSVLAIMIDVGIFLGLTPNSIFQNVKYILQKKYHEHLKVAPLYVMSVWLGWLVGRIKYRAEKP
ncbi:MAG: hypothetical protein BA861_00300 [Desulfobacterales bacterium S3730MH5]|nr:MAG: hypothetical protein BA861_00300 [Desulfobacterales bacterium S3730MH5]OEU79369.1 MAG: hypothetical protein BA873_08935 [Desulfobulbaceae bacterium C00003063]OEU81939.1 MAG: hypothetical protein BA865_08980 [Desulfobacterales bacterium S5133MH4]